MLEPILQQVGAGNPQLAQLIGQNQEQFLQLLSEDLDDESMLPPGTQAITVTEEERDAIERVRIVITLSQYVSSFVANIFPALSTRFPQRFCHSSLLCV